MVKVTCLRLKPSRPPLPFLANQSPGLAYHGRRHCERLIHQRHLLIDVNFVRACCGARCCRPPDVAKLSTGSAWIDHRLHLLFDKYQAPMFSGSSCTQNNSATSG